MLLREEKTDAALGVSRRVQYLGRQIGKAEGQAIVGTGIRGRDFRRGNTKPTSLHLHHAQQVQIPLVEKHRCPGRFLQQSRSAYVIDMGMSNDNLAQGQAVFLKPGENLGNVVSGVDDHGFAGNFVAQDGAVAAQWTYGKAFKDHSSILGLDLEINFDGCWRWVQCGMRVYAAAGALLGWFALALQFYLVLVQSHGGLAMLGVVIVYFSFFTILTNILVALVFTAIAMDPAVGWLRFFSSSPVQAATTVYIAIVGAVYQLLLRQLWNPQGAQWVADVLLHAVIPVGYVLYWFLFAPRAGLRWKDAVGWLVYPGVYLVYVLARGAVSGDYPYPFVDVNVLGYGGVLARAAGLMLVFLGMGLLVVAVGRWTGERRFSTQKSS
jgi:hypothetical protein